MARLSGRNRHFNKFCICNCTLKLGQSNASDDAVKSALTNVTFRSCNVAFSIVPTSHIGQAGGKRPSPQSPTNANAVRPRSFSLKVSTRPAGGALRWEQFGRVQAAQQADWGCVAAFEIDPACCGEWAGEVCGDA